MQLPSEPLDLALLMADHGVPVFPIALSWNDGKGKTDKRPLTPHGHLDASTDPDVVRRLFATAPRLRDGEALGYGMRPGAAGLVVIDADQHPGGADGVTYARESLCLPPHTFTVATATGEGRHYFLRKRDVGVAVGNHNGWSDHGVDVRADDGWVVGVGTSTPWGSWTVAPNSPDFGQFAMVPLDKWQQLSPSTSSSTDVTPSAGKAWQRYDPARHDDLLHPATLKALEAVRAEKGEVLAFRERADGDPYLDITCDGHSVSATLGYVGPGILNVFSSGWPGRVKGPQDVLLQSWPGPSEGTEAAEVDLFDLAVEREAQRLRIAEAARQRVRAENRPAAPEFDIGLLDEVAARPEDFRWRVEGLIPAEGNATIVAQRKTGKTTMTTGLARDLLTGEPFLGHFAVQPLVGKVAFLNFEVSAHQIARWAVEAQVPGDRLVLVNLRGRRNPFGNPEDLDALAAKLRAQEVEALIVDPFGRAFPGANPSDNGEVGPWLTVLDQFGAAVGSEHIIMAVHAGWAGDRSRGASVLEDWPDSILRLKRDENGTARYFRAEGRDVGVEEDRLDFDPVTRRLALSGAGNLQAHRHLQHLSAVSDGIVDALRSQPGLSVTELTDVLRGAGVGLQRGDVSRAAGQLQTAGLVERRKVGRSVHHYLTSPDQSRSIPTGLVDTSRPVPLGRDVSKDVSATTSPERQLDEATTLLQATLGAEVVA